MPDELRDRFQALHDDTRQLAPYGLADVRRRRLRRQRNTAAGVSLAVVSVVASAALLLHPTGDPQSIAPIAPASTTGTTSAPRTTSTPSTAAAPTTASQPTSEPEPTSGSASSSAASSSPGTPTSGAASPAILPVGPGSLLSVPQLAAAGVGTAGPATADRDGAPSLPTMCNGGTWQEQYSNPTGFVSQDYPVTDGTLTEDVLGYPSDTAANLALVKLKDDARACPTVFEFTTISVGAVGQSIGDEFVLFTLHNESGLDGSITDTPVVIARTGNVLVSVAAPTETEARSAAAAGVTQAQAL